MVLIVLTGHADAQRDHATLSAMRESLSTSDPELNYSSAFRKSLQFFTKPHTDPEPEIVYREITRGSSWQRS
jgi:hypothetical protein